MIELSELFEELSVNFISIQDNVDTSTSMGRFFFRVMASLAELERDSHIERIKEAISDGAEVLGYCTWSYTDLLSWL
ncbi:hypothetical protein EfmJHP36_26200 [Enterococcus faecium]|nr:hypothetical protein EfmJHP36_26200 [Enterococcus faecium]